MRLIVFQFFFYTVLISHLAAKTIYFSQAEAQFIHTVIKMKIKTEFTQVNPLT